MKITSLPVKRSFFANKIYILLGKILGYKTWDVGCEIWCLVLVPCLYSLSPCPLYFLFYIFELYHCSLFYTIFCCESCIDFYNVFC